MKSILFFSFICVAVFTTPAQTLKIMVSGIRSTSGTIRLAFYNTAKGFDEEKALFIKTITKKEINKGVVNVSYTDIKEGVYGIAVLDDENSNQKMDYGLIMPKEGFGFSDYYHTGMSRPKFDMFDFVLKNEIKTVFIKLRYL